MIAGARDATPSGSAAALMLSHVRDLVGDELEAGLAVRIVGASGEVDVLAEREGAGVEQVGGRGGALVGVDADAARIDAQRQAQLIAELGGQRRRPAAVGEEIEGDGQGSFMGKGLLLYGASLHGGRGGPPSLVGQEPSRVPQGLRRASGSRLRRPRPLSGHLALRERLGSASELGGRGKAHVIKGGFGGEIFVVPAGLGPRLLHAVPDAIVIATHLRSTFGTDVRGDVATLLRPACLLAS